MREMDQYGFPVPASFDEPSTSRSRRARDPRPLLLVALVILASLGIAALIHFGDDIANLGDQWALLRKRRLDALSVSIQASWRQGNYDRALVDCKKMSAIDAKIGAYFTALTLTKAGRLLESIRAYSKLIELQPDFAMAYNDRAYHRALLNIELEEAESDIAKAISLSADRVPPAYIDTRGYLHLLRGRNKEALADFNSVLNNPDARLELGQEGAGEVLYHRGLVYMKLNERKLAMNDFVAARNLGFDRQIPMPPEEGNAKPELPTIGELIDKLKKDINNSAKEQKAKRPTIRLEKNSKTPMILVEPRDVDPEFKRKRMLRDQILFKQMLLKSAEAIQAQYPEPPPVQVESGQAKADRTKEAFQAPTSKAAQRANKSAGVPLTATPSP